MVARFLYSSKSEQVLDCKGKRNRVFPINTNTRARKYKSNLPPDPSPVLVSSFSFLFVLLVKGNERELLGTEHFIFIFSASGSSFSAIYGYAIVFKTSFF